jgi:hypothetical protein
VEGTSKKGAALMWGGVLIAWVTAAVDFSQLTFGLEDQIETAVGYALPVLAVVIAAVLTLSVIRKLLGLSDNRPYNDAGYRRGPNYDDGGAFDDWTEEEDERG